jgi:lipid-binding SYLF domain-containing protein
MRYGQFKPVKDTAARTVVSLSLLLAICWSLEVGHAADAPEEQRLVEEATVTFERFLENRSLAFWYRGQAKNIKAVFIVPKFLRGAFLVGAGGGKGVLLAQDFVHGGWSFPAFYGMSVASVGLQAGFDSSEVVMIIQTFAGLERFYGAGTVKLGLDAGLTVGPWGEGGTTGLDIVTFTWSKGLFGGMSLDGLAVTAYDGSNEAYYGSQVKPEQILATNAFSNHGADRLRAVVGRPTTP